MASRLRTFYEVVTCGKWVWSTGGLPCTPVMGYTMPMMRAVSMAPLVPWKCLPLPTPWEQVFGRSAPLHLELGFGLGDYLVRIASVRPHENFVGIETEWSALRRTLEKLDRTPRRNVALVRADAVPALERIFRERSLSSAWALFPCPWPKHRHLRLRLFSHAFLLLLNARLVDQGEAFLVTDDAAYADWVCAEAKDTGFEVSRNIVPPQFETRYEKRWQEHGQETFLRIDLRKIVHMSMPLEEVSPMQSPLIPRLIPDRLQLREVTDGITLVPKDHLYDAAQERGMVRVILVEGTFSQDFWIEIVRKGEAWAIRPAKGCGVLPTSGLQKALDLIRDQLLVATEGET